MQPDTSGLTPIQSDVLELLKNAQNGIKRHDLQMYIFHEVRPNLDRAIRHAIRKLRDL